MDKSNTLEQTTPPSEKKITKLFFGEACSFIDPSLNISLISTNGSLVVWGPVVWIPGILIWKGLLLKGTLRISNHRDPNQQLTMNWWELIHNNTIYFHQWCFSSSYLLGLETLPRKKNTQKTAAKTPFFGLCYLPSQHPVFPPPASTSFRKLSKKGRAWLENAHQTKLGVPTNWKVQEDIVYLDVCMYIYILCSWILTTEFQANINSQ